jgi:hypothetical protein
VLANVSLSVISFPFSTAFSRITSEIWNKKQGELKARIVLTVWCSLIPAGTLFDYVEWGTFIHQMSEARDDEDTLHPFVSLFVVHQITQPLHHIRCKNVRLEISKWILLCFFLTRDLPW